MNEWVSVDVFSNEMQKHNSESVYSYSLTQNTKLNWVLIINY